MELTDQSFPSRNWHVYFVVAAFAATIFLGCIFSPPSLMDDVDSVQSQVARNMLTSHDWVTARIDGVPYFEKAPMNYWMMAVSYLVFGPNDWAARLPHALSAIALALLTSWFALWAFGRKAAFYSGLCITTCIGLFLFTRIQIPDVTLTLCVTFSLFAFVRTLDEAELRPKLWAALFPVGLAIGLLIKSLVAIVIPLAAAFLFLLITRQLFTPRTWQRLRPLSALFVFAIIAAPWHILATVRNPPYFAWTLHSGPGQYRGFLWFFVVNEQLLRYLNLRYPRDYATISRPAFWLLHLVWLFPWSVYLPATVRLSYKSDDRAGRTRLLTLCWLAFVLLFFTFSTTQEYYSMPAYSAFALLLGSAIATQSNWVRNGTRALALLSAAAALAAFVILWIVRAAPAPGDITTALSSNPQAYKESLGHMQDLTLQSFAYLRFPLVLAAIAFLLGSLAMLRWTASKAAISAALMMALLFHAARQALIVFDPVLSSRSFAEVLRSSPPGTLIVERHYYDFSSVAFYLNRPVLLLNAKSANLEYGSNAPGAPPVFIDDAAFRDLWLRQDRFYLLAKGPAVARLEKLVGSDHLLFLAHAGDKSVITNHPLQLTQLTGDPANPSAN